MGIPNKGGTCMKIEYVRSGDYYIPNLPLPQETRSIGKWGRLHRRFLEEHHPIQYANLVLSCKLWTYLADLNEQAQERLDVIIRQMQIAEGVTEALKASDPIAWARNMNSIRARAEEIIWEELIYV